MHITSVRSQPVQSSGTYLGARSGGGVPDGGTQEIGFLPTLEQAVSLAYVSLPRFSLFLELSYS